ncbi:hypothetical protein RFI_28907, partial [Reticulomyxa filosa]
QINNNKKKRRIITEHSIFSFGYSVMGIGGFFLAYFYFGANVESYEGEFSDVLGMLLIGNPLLDALMWCYFKYLPERRVKKQKKRLNKKLGKKGDHYQQLSEEKDVLAEEKEKEKGRGAKRADDEEEEEEQEEEEQEDDNDDDEDEDGGETENENENTASHHSNNGENRIEMTHLKNRKKKPKKKKYVDYTSKNLLHNNVSEMLLAD